MNFNNCSFLLCCRLLLIHLSGAYSDETVFTPNGPIVGRKIIAANKEQIFTFQGIPYAEPPTGNARFQYPRKAELWADMAQNASTPYTGACLQKATLAITGSEDCLHINIFTPTRNDNELLPVFVWIHNHHSKGGISSWSPESGYRDNIAARHIVAVTFNYRLDVMALNESVNLGFKDQQLALQWIQENIVYFGGDRTRVTLAASGSGAEFVLTHMKDRTSHGLFSAAILQSGQYARDRFMSCKAISILKKRVGCSDEDLQCLNRKSSNHLITKSQDLNFVPCNTHFKTTEPIVNKVPVIIGFNLHESAADEIFRILYKQDEIANFNQTHFLEKLSETAEALAMDDYKALLRVRRLLLKTYLTELQPPETWFDRYIKMTTEANFQGPMLDVIQMLLGVDVYVYVFEHISPAEMIGLPWRGVIHGAELQYLFSQPGVSIRTDLKFQPTTRDLNMVNTIGTLWTNFVKYGDPTPQSSDVKWHQVDPTTKIRNGQLNHLVLRELPRIHNELSSKTATIWVDELPNYPTNAGEQIDVRRFMTARRCKQPTPVNQQDSMEILPLL